MNYTHSCEYQVCSHEDFVEGERVLQYGLICFDHCGTQILRIDGISVDLKEMQEFSNLLNREMLEFRHFEDVVDDFLTR